MPSNKYPFEPGYTIHPSATLLETVAYRIAYDSPVEMEDVESFMRGEIGVWPELADALELAFDIPSHFWMNLQVNYESAMKEG